MKRMEICSLHSGAFALEGIMGWFETTEGDMVRPTRNRVFIRPADIKPKTKGGLVIADIIQQYIPPQQGVVVAVGEEVIKVRVGDSVVWGLGTGKYLDLGDEKILCVKASQLIGTLN